MQDVEYQKSSYLMAVSDGCDSLTVEKTPGSGWVKVDMTTNCSPNGEITIRSKRMVEQLHFMLGQMLGEQK